MSNFANEHEVHLGNTMDASKCIHLPTWISADKATQKHLDYCAVDNWLQK